MNDTKPNQEATARPWYKSVSEGDNQPYIVAKDLRHGQSSGIVLIAAMKVHRMGSADRVCPHEIQNSNAALIVRAVNEYDALIAAEKLFKTLLNHHKPECRCMHCKAIAALDDLRKQ